MGGSGSSEDAVLRPAFDFAVAFVKIEEGAGTPAPAPFRPLLKLAALRGPALGQVRRALEADPELRERIAAVPICEDEVGRAGWLWLARPEGWEDEFAALAAAVDAPGEGPGGLSAKQQRAAVGRQEKAARQAESAKAELARARAELAAAGQRADAADARAERMERKVKTLSEQWDSALRRATAAEEEAAELRRELARVSEELREGAEALRAAEAALQEAPAASAPPAPEAPATEPSAPVVGAAVDAPSGPAVSPTAPFDVAAAAAVAAAVAEAGRAAAALGEALARAGSVLGEVVPGAGDGGGLGDPKPGADAVVARRARRPRTPRTMRCPARLPLAVFDDSPEAAQYLVGLEDVVLLVDGYNVSKLRWPELGIADQRPRLVGCLDRLSARTGAEVVVVFDSDETLRMADPNGNGNGRRGVAVRYAPPGVEADDVIIGLVGEVPLHRPVVVASADRRVQRGVREQGANVISSGQLVTLF